MLILNLFYITFSIVYIIKYSSIIFDFSKWLYESAYGKTWNYQMLRKPFSCDVCVTFWIVLLYSLFNTSFILSILYATLFSGIVVPLMEKIYELIMCLINKIELW